MPDDTKHGASCIEFEALLSDAIEGRLTGASKESDSFEVHRRTCAVCGPLFADALAGRELLRSLEPVEPPTYLVHNILAATSGVVSTRVVRAGTASATPRGERLREWGDSWFAPAAFCHVVRDDLLLALAGLERGRGQGSGRGEDRSAAGGAAARIQ